MTTMIMMTTMVIGHVDLMIMSRKCWLCKTVNVKVGDNCDDADDDDDHSAVADDDDQDDDDDHGAVDDENDQDDDDDQNDVE